MIHPAAASWTDFGQFIYNVGMGVWAIWVFVAQRRAARKDHVDAKLAGHDVRLTTLEQKAEHAPKHGDLAVIYERLNTAVGALSQLQGQFGQMNRTLDLMHQHLLQGGKDK